ncbi:MAG: alanine racemase [Parachlamydiales bacterium]|nr:alanine racemase [Parachlamydiales bacterium]
MNLSSYIEVDLKQFKKNLLIIKENLKDSLFCLPVKANAYGHGLVEIAKVAQDEKVVDYLACATLEEGKMLRDANIKIPILMLGSFFEDQIEDLIKNDLEVTISSFLKAKIIKDFCDKNNKKCKVHLKIDTGMKRIGVRPQTAEKLLEFLNNEDCFIIKGIFSHFACAENKDHPFNQIQLNEFSSFIKQVNPPKDVLCHLANSAGVLYFENGYFDMVRPGALAYGCYTANMPEKFEGIKSIFSLKSRVSFFKVVNENEGISYSHTYVTKNKTRILTIPIGYGDGYFRSLSNKAKVLINGRKYPIVGTICMDQLMVDIQNDSVFVDDEVVLIGKQKDQEISLLDIAELLHTVTYEILCSFNKRLARIYKN